MQVWRPSCNPGAAEEETGESLQLTCLVSLRLLRELISKKKKKAQGAQHLKNNRRGFGLAFIGMPTRVPIPVQAHIHRHTYMHTSTRTCTNTKMKFKNNNKAF